MLIYYFVTILLVRERPHITSHNITSYLEKEGGGGGGRGGAKFGDFMTFWAGSGNLCYHSFS